MSDESNLSAALPPELFQKIKAIQIRTQRLVTDVLAGEYESAFKGRGMEFEEVREYAPGDDVRHIDWNVTARTGAPHIKVHREERELTVMLAVDVSSSGAFGSSDKLKHEIAAEVAAVLAYTAIKSNDRVGLIIFSDRIEKFVPPRKGRRHVLRLLRELLYHRPEGRGTDITAALEYLTHVQRKKAVTFLISDFRDEGFERALSVRLTAPTRFGELDLSSPAARQLALRRLGRMPDPDALLVTPDALARSERLGPATAHD